MGKKQLLIELAMPVVFIILSVLIIADARTMGSEGVFPIMSAGALLICAVYLLAEVIMKKKAVVNLTGVNLKMVGFTLLVLICYIFLLKRIGYFIDTVALCFFIILSLGYRRTGVAAICSVLTVLGVFLIFKVLLSVPLPMVLLDF